MNILPTISACEEELISLFRDFHAHPEIGFEERRTCEIVAAKLREYGVDDIETGIAETGVVATIQGKGKGNRRVGLRADMDALPIHETTALPYASRTPGVMHACGHDGHTAMLLGAAKHLADTRDFDGIAVLIFQPAEEGLGGARRMIAEGLFDRFPCDEIYGLHNTPNGQPGRFGICKGPALAGAIFFDCTVTGVGAHAAHPDEARDALMAAASLITEFNSIVARNIPANDACVLSVTKMSAGTAYNILPETAHFGGTVRYFNDSVAVLVQERMKSICDGFALAHGVTIDLDLRNIFDVLINDDALSDAYIEAAIDVVGSENVAEKEYPTAGSEDFADMLKVVPGAYCSLGHSGNAPLHNPGFVLGEEILATGASIMARLVERRLAL